MGAPPRNARPTRATGFSQAADGLPGSHRLARLPSYLLYQLLLQTAHHCVTSGNGHPCRQPQAAQTVHNRMN